MKKAKKHLNKAPRGQSPPRDPNKEPRQEYFLTPEEMIKNAYCLQHKIKLYQRPKDALVKEKALANEKLKVFGSYLERRVSAHSKKFPNIENLNPFYRGLLGSILDVDLLKQKLATLKAGSEVLAKIRRGYGGRIYASKSPDAVKRILREYEGRACSVIKKTAVDLKWLKKESKKMIELPTIDFEAPLVVLAGFPNVGKSTILNRLTGSKAKVESYQFTTKQVNLGRMEVKYRKVQVVDTPGLLDRKTLSSIEQKAVASLKHLACMVVFVADPTGTSGFTINDQHSLYKNLERQLGKHFIIVLNKMDKATEEQAKEARELFGEIVEDSNELAGANLKEKISEELPIIKKW